MPHDVNGNLLTVGDHVSLKGTITEIHSTENLCNCTVKLDQPMPGADYPTTISALNTRQVEKVGS